MIIRNAARCRACGDEIESTHRHDFKGCFCGAIFVDGGRDYLRAGFEEEWMYENLSEVIDEADDRSL